tara:strand:+ start:1032 stop:1904 length:873 start_codon:yes stop_codon:yes gene_type:complete
MIIEKIKSNPVKIILFIIVLLVLTNTGFENLINMKKNKIGLVEIDFPITSSRNVVEDLNYFKNRNDINAIVVRVDSPGGSVAASQEIYHKIKAIADNGKPVYISMGNVAASGGYYLSLGADTIIANLGTTTGSIGVIMGYPIINDLMNDIGIEYNTVKSGLYKDSGSSFRESTIEDQKYFENLVKDLHSQFVNVIVKERNIKIESVEKLANGKVYSGKQALDYNLIDMIGTLDDAFMIANKSIGNSKEPIIILPPQEKGGIFDIIFNNINSSTNTIINMTYPKPLYKMMF